MKKYIFINNTAATSGGALTILREFIENVANKCNKNYIFYIFCTADLKHYESDNIKIINNINAKSWKNRIIWDSYGLKRWSKENNINPDLIISLQNTGVLGFKKVPKFIYVHQSLPYYTEIKWNLLNKEERLYWLYKHVYKYFIQVAIRNAKVIVQTEWMKRAVSDIHKKHKDDIYIIPPTIMPIDKNNISTIDKKEDIMLFYPASACIYKNHKVIVDAIKLLKEKNFSKSIKLYLTLDESSQYVNELKSYIRANELYENIKFIGYLNYDDILAYYNTCDIVVFPSYIETYGLPLIEAAQFNKPIVASDLDYSKEVLKNYIGVYYATYNDAHQWADKIEEAYKNKKCKYELILNDDNSWLKFIEIIEALS